MSSSKTSETLQLQKFGFDKSNDNSRTFTTISNRLRISNQGIDYFREVIVYMQIISIAFLAPYGGVLKESGPLKFLYTWFAGCINMLYFVEGLTGNIVLLMIMFAFMVLWLILYMFFSIRYNTSKTFSRGLVKFLGFWSYQFFHIFTPDITTCCISFLIKLLQDAGSVDTTFCFFAILEILLLLFLDLWLIRMHQSSPDLDVYNKLAYWPQEILCPMYSMLVRILMPAIIVVFDIKSFRWAAGFFNIVFGLIGLILHHVRDYNLFYTGKAVICLEYVILILGGIITTAFHFIGGNGLYYIVTCLFLCIIIYFILQKYEFHHEKGIVDLLYKPFDTISLEMTSPTDCARAIRIGIIYAVPSVLNKSFLKWAISRFANDHDLYLFISYIYFLEQSPYSEILELVGTAVDVEPFNEYDGLMFYQIFNRLPTQEKSLAKHMEVVKRLYDLPRQSLRSFWEAVLSLQWDECGIRLLHLTEDLKDLHDQFDHIIFENPASDSVMSEFIKFSTEIEGNYAAAAAAERELIVRKAIRAENEENAQNQQNAGKNNPNASVNSVNSKNFENQSVERSNGSNLNLSRLSSVRSSVFMSEASQLGAKGANRVQNAIYQAIECRPVFAPANIFFRYIILLCLGLASLMVVFVFIYNKVHRLNQQTLLSGVYFQMDHALTQIAIRSLKFLTNGLPITETLDGKEFDFDESSAEINQYCQDYDTLFADSFSISGAVPDTFLRFWVDSYIESTFLLPDKEHVGQRNLTLIEAARMFQVRSRNLVFIPENTLGSYTDPNDEIVQLVYMYAAVASSCSIMIMNVQNIVFSEKEVTSRKVYIIIGIILGVDFILFIVFVIQGYLCVRKEMNFFLSLYASMPMKQVYTILKKEKIHQAMEDHANANDETLDKPTTFSIYEAHMSPTQYLLLPILFLGIWCLILIPIPIIWILIGFNTHIDASLFVVRGMYQSTRLLGCFGTVGIDCYRVLTEFLARKEEDFHLIRENNDLMFRYYLNLFFGYQHLVAPDVPQVDYKDTLIGKYSYAVKKIRTDQIEENGNCSFVTLDGIDSYCMSFHDTVFYIYNHVNRLLKFLEIDHIQTSPVIESVDQTKRGLGTTWWREFFKFVETTLDSGIPSFYELFLVILNDNQSQMELFLLLGLFLGVALFVILICVVWTYCFKSIKHRIKSMLRPILLMGPEPIMESPMIVKFLQGDYDTPSRLSSSAADSKKLKDAEGSVPLINYILEGVLVCSADGTIIASNKIYHTMMGNTAEDVLGLNVRAVMPDSLNPVFDAMNVVANGGILEQVVTLETVFFTEDAKEINARVTLVVELESGETGNKSTPCGLIVSDRSELIKSQSQLLEEKKNVEQLLDQVLPHTIAVSLLNGNRDISFEVQKALVLFSDIVSFTPMSSNMTAKNVMIMLNRLFKDFDIDLATFKRVTKLKTIGDAYVCAAGIFEGDGPIEEAAKEIVTFATHMQQIIPRLNTQYGYKIHMRIGVDAGGPLICGVLGKEKPLFEVIGATVTIAEELEASSLHDKIHISVSTAELLEGKGFKMEPRDPPVKVIGLPEGATTYTIIQ